MSHEILNNFTLKDGQLYLSDRSISQIVNIAGDSPLYVYDRQLISDKVSSLRKALPEKVEIHYALKANPMPALVHHMSGLVDGFDITSLRELHTAINTGMDTSDISFAGPGKSSAELKAAISCGITLHIESTIELEKIQKIAQELAIKPKVAVRVNPLFELQSSGMKMSGGAKQFGIDEELVPEVLETIHKYDMSFEGLHIFSGSQNLNPDAIIETHNKTFELSEKLLENAPMDFNYVNIGGGFGIPYFPKDKTLDLQPISENLSRLMAESNCLKDKKIIIELGRYLVGEAGFYVCKVRDVKMSRGKKFLVCDGGLHHHLANSGNFGQVIRRNYPVVISKKNPSTSTETEAVEIVGLLCTPLDKIGEKMELPSAEPGDYVVVMQSGAYGKSASPEGFLSHNPAKELLI